MSDLVTPAEVRDLAARGAVLLDVQWNLTVTPDTPAGDELYARGHLPRAVHLDVDTDLSDPVRPGGAGGRHPLPDPGRLQARLRACGVDDDSTVVVHDQGTGFGAARAWWVLRWAGLRDVRVLDGGLRAWTAEGGVLTTDSPTPVPGHVTLHPGALPTVDADGAAAAARDGVLLDVRAPERFRGELEPLDPVAGHVPGAVNAPTTALVGADGRYLPSDALRRLFAAVGVHPGDGPDRVVAQCGSGVTAAHTVLALRHVGVDAALYPGSWSDWVSDPTRPVATGPTGEERGSRREEPDRDDVPGREEAHLVRGEVPGHPARPATTRPVAEHDDVRR